jgi:hypothetical protein
MKITLADFGGEAKKSAPSSGKGTRLREFHHSQIKDSPHQFFILH